MGLRGQEGSNSGGAEVSLWTVDLGMEVGISRGPGSWLPDWMCF